MTSGNPPASTFLVPGTLAANKQRVASLKERGRALFESGASGLAVATFLSEQSDKLVVELFEQVLEGVSPEIRQAIAADSAIVAVGGTGRGELAPYSDIDLLFLSGGGDVPAEYRTIVNTAVQTYWDAGIKLGHAVRTSAECLTLARTDPQIATALIESRRLWGNQELVDGMIRRFRRRVVDSRRQSFVADCLLARWPDGNHGPPQQELEPDVKASQGGLRDLHLIRWIGYALYDSREVDGLRLNGALSADEAVQLKEAWEFLTRIRIDLHYAANKSQDRLTRDEQLRITEQLKIESTPAQRAVEVFMQRYFHHTSNVSRISRRFAALHRQPSYRRQLKDFLFGHRADGILRVSPEEIDAPKRHLQRITRDLSAILRVYRAAALYGVRPSRRVEEAIANAVPDLSGEVTEPAARLFMDILKSTRSLPALLRSMYETGLIEVLIPDVKHTRNLMQFNQYHHFTVDEHTLQAIERCTEFENDQGPVGKVYALIRQKDLLHLAIILHDIGKGFGRPHSEVGKEISDRICRRLSLPPALGEIVSRLVLRHLEMAHIAFRRDISDPETLQQFAGQVGTPEVLQMLYVLTAADISAVGPSAWTEWKAELLASLYQESLVVVCGQKRSDYEVERTRSIAAEVRDAMPEGGERKSLDEIKASLKRFPTSYLTHTPPARIAGDLAVIRNLKPDDVVVKGQFDFETGTVEYRIITANPAIVEGCFHKLAGALTARRLQILAADIATTTDGVVVDSFRVLDRDFAGAPDEERIQSVTASLHDVLFGREGVECLFRRNKRFGSEPRRTTFADLPLRVQMDTGSSETRTIIDVFAHDRPGLLFTLSRAIFEMGLSVELAKIATNFDQVVDVFYVVEKDGTKVTDPARVAEIEARLLQVLQAFDRDGYREFAT